MGRVTCIRYWQRMSSFNILASKTRSLKSPPSKGHCHDHLGRDVVNHNSRESPLAGPFLSTSSQPSGLQDRIYLKAKTFSKSKSEQAC